MPASAGRVEEASMYNEILFEIDDGVATLTLNRPQTLNALTFAMM